MEQKPMNSGTYTFENRLNAICGQTCGCTTAEECVFPKPEADVPTVSLYNLLDHSAADLKFLLIGIQRECQNLEPYKLLVADTYTSICAWAKIIEAAHKERVKRDSEAWAEKTAKEILGNDNCGPEHNV